MTELRLHRRVVHTVFDLLGDREDDLTYSLGWALGQSDELVATLMAECIDGDPGTPTVVRLQDTKKTKGRTDIEVQTQKAHLILEAKVGWDLPRPGQLKRYVARFQSDHALRPVIAVVAEGSAGWARTRGLEEEVAGIPVVYLPWRRVAALVDKTARQVRSHAEKRLLRELHAYLKGVMTVQDITSNMVFVVPIRLGEDLCDGGPSWLDIVTKHRRYFHPFEGKWPKEPPNYIGFRYEGAVQEIRHVESSELLDAPWEQVPGLEGKLSWPRWPGLLYKLGPAIRPDTPPRTDGLYGPGHHWAALDLLLTCGSLRVARDKSQARLAAAGQES